MNKHTDEVQYRKHYTISFNTEETKKVCLRYLVRCRSRLYLLVERVELVVATEDKPRATFAVHHHLVHLWRIVDGGIRIRIRIKPDQRLLVVITSHCEWIKDCVKDDSHAKAKLVISFG